jgi:multidrug efflux pump subunit AcrA (membrane-fusion protein)
MRQRQQRTTRHVAIGAIALAWSRVGWKTLHQPATAAIAPPTLGVAAPLVSQVVQWDDYVGRFAPSQTVEVRPRVAGQITALHFRDGDIVQKGQILFTVDQRPIAPLWPRRRPMSPGTQRAGSGQIRSRSCRPPDR